MLCKSGKREKIEKHLALKISPTLTLLWDNIRAPLSKAPTGKAPWPLVPASESSCGMSLDDTFLDLWPKGTLYVA